MQQQIPPLKLTAYIGGLLGLALLTVLVVRSDFAAMWHTIRTSGWDLLWLTPYRIIYFLLYAIGWRTLLRPYDPQGRRASATCSGSRQSAKASIACYP